MDRQDIIDKIEYEGGVDEVLKYGITANDIDDEGLRYRWSRLEDAWSEYKEIEDEVAEHLGLY